jgi:Tyrosine phosphatase family
LHKRDTLENKPLSAPYSGLLVIDVVTTPGGGCIGMMNCPGRCSGRWARDLLADLTAVQQWRADILLTLIEDREFIGLGVPDFADHVRTQAYAWYRLPIADFNVPDAEALAVWQRVGPEVLGKLRSGGRVAIHCAAGLGRTGTIAAKLLTALGVAPDAAIVAVRRARPGTIETAAQETFVQRGPSFSI